MTAAKAGHTQGGYLSLVSKVVKTTIENKVGSINMLWQIFL